MSGVQSDRINSTIFCKNKKAIEYVFDRFLKLRRFYCFLAHQSGVDTLSSPPSKPTAFS